MERVIYIAWDEETADSERVYIGGGEYDTKAVNRRLETKKARYSAYTLENKAKADEYVADEIRRGDVREYQLNYRVIVE